MFSNDLLKGEDAKVVFFFAIVKQSLFRRDKDHFFKCLPEQNTLIDIGKCPNIDIDV